MTDTEIVNAIKALLVSGELPSAVPEAWIDSPGAPVVPGTPCYDNVAESLRYAANGFNSSGVRQITADDLPAAIERARKLVVADRAGREALVKGAGALDPDTAAVAVLTGYLNGGGLGGEYYLTLGATSLAALIAKPGTVGHPGIAV